MLITLILSEKLHEGLYAAHNLFHTLASIYLLKVNYRNTRTRCNIEQDVTLEQDVSIVNFEHISHLALVFLLLTLNM